MTLSSDSASPLKPASIIATRSWVRESVPVGGRLGPETPVMAFSVPGLAPRRRDEETSAAQAVNSWEVRGKVL